MIRFVRLPEAAQTSRPTVSSKVRHPAEGEESAQPVVGKNGAEQGCVGSANPWTVECKFFLSRLRRVQYMRM